MQEFYREVKKLDPASRNMALTVLDGKFAGEKALVSDGRILWRSMEGGLLAGRPQLEEFHGGHGLGDVQNSGIYSIGGSTVFCDLFAREKKIVICGGGHVSIPIIKISRMMGMEVHVLEDRPVFADHARRAGASMVVCRPFDQGLAGIQGDLDTFFVIVTRGHRYDQICLETIARKPHAYIGMIGSRRRVGLVKEAAITGGASPEVIRRVYTPIGLDIGAETPEEIAVAVMAEIIQVKNRERRSGGYTREILDGILGTTDGKWPDKVRHNRTELDGTQPDRAGRVEAEPDGARRDESWQQEMIPDSAQSDCPEDSDVLQMVLATIIVRRGSAPRQTGTKMLVRSDGTCVGTIGGGCVEAELVRGALSMIRSGAPAFQVCHVDMTGQDAEDLGMACGGTMEVMLELVSAVCRRD